MAISLADAGRVAWRCRPDTLAERWSAGRWRAAPHHRYLADKIVDCINRPNGRLIITMPPRHGKSELASFWSIVWALQLNPALRVILASYDDTLARSFGRQVRNVLREFGYEYGVEIDAATSSANDWLTLAGGGMRTAGIQGGITGRGADLLVIDDPFKNHAEAKSQTIRDKVWDFYTSTARTRLQSGASVIIIQTRWHEDDLVGRLLAAAKDGDEYAEQWDVVNMAAIAEHDETYDLRPVKGNPVSTFRRKTGDPLWVTAFPLPQLYATRSALGPYLWNALYQQHPAPPEGSILKRGWFKTYTGLPSLTERDDAIVTVDASFKDADDNSYCVMQVWYRYGGRKYLIAQLRDHMDYPTLRDTLAAVAYRYPECRSIYVEDKANGPAVIADLQGRVSGLIPWSPEGSKESRVHAVSGDIESGNVFLPSAAQWKERLDFIEECAAFPNAAHDDQVDAMVMALLLWPNMLDMITEYDPFARLGVRRR